LIKNYNFLLKSLIFSLIKKFESDKDFETIINKFGITMKIFQTILLIVIISFYGCSSSYFSIEERFLQEEKLIMKLEKNNIDIERIKKLNDIPLYNFEPEDVDYYLRFLQIFEPDLRKRIDHIARKNINQPYNIYLLGEFPFEIYDYQPLFTLKESDCVVFCEHTYAMAFSNDWKSFFTMLQRIRYKNGNIGYITRNHYTEADWDINNSWFLSDLTNELLGDKTKKVSTKIDRAKFFRKYNIGQDIPIQNFDWEYIPYKFLEQVKGHLETGDFVNIVRGYSEYEVYVGHTGLISVDEKGDVFFIHSTSPKVKIQPIEEYMNEQLALTEKRKADNLNSSSPQPYFYGFKFFRLDENYMENLINTDGENAPAIKIYGR